jgi:hypothetical protein
MTLASGARLGAYEIISFITAGGMGEVYKGRDPHQNGMGSRKVAQGMQ